jgi:hypothetical protein
MRTYMYYPDMVDAELRRLRIDVDILNDAVSNLSKREHERSKTLGALYTNLYHKLRQFGLRL